MSRLLTNDKEHIVSLYYEGQPANEIAKQFGLSKSTIYNWIKSSRPIVNKTTGNQVTYEQYLRLQKNLQRRNYY